MVDSACANAHNWQLENVSIQKTASKMALSVEFIKTLLIPYYRPPFLRAQASTATIYMTTIISTLFTLRPVGRAGHWRRARPIEFSDMVTSLREWFQTQVFLRSFSSIHSSYARLSASNRQTPLEERSSLPLKVLVKVLRRPKHLLVV